MCVKEERIEYKHTYTGHTRRHEVNHTASGRVEEKKRREEEETRSSEARDGDEITKGRKGK